MTWSPTTCRRWLVQAQAAQTLAGSDNVRAREAMRAVEDAGRTALVEMRRLLGVIRADEPVDTPGNRALQPRLEDLPGLVLAGVVCNWTPRWTWPRRTRRNGRCRRLRPVRGRGLAGMRERVALFDGKLETGPLPDGGFAVHAILPLGRR